MSELISNNGENLFFGIIIDKDIHLKNYNLESKTVLNSSEALVLKSDGND